MLVCFRSEENCKLTVTLFQWHVCLAHRLSLAQGDDKETDPTGEDGLRQAARRLQRTLMESVKPESGFWAKFRQSVGSGASKKEKAGTPPMAPPPIDTGTANPFKNICLTQPLTCFERFNTW
jgi:hypothetical protein